MRRFLAVLVLVALAGPLAAQDFKWHGALASGKSLEVRGVNGSIHAVRASGGEATVTAVKRARHDDPDEVEIKVEETSSGVIICALYPNRSGNSRGCAQGHSDGERNKGNDTEVNFEVAVPAGVRVTLTTVNGDVRGQDLASDADLTTVNGDIDVATSGLAEATTVNGSIEASLGRQVPSGGLKFTTVNGGIRVTVPTGLGCDLDATTVNGSVTTDFPVTVSGRVQPRSLRGRIGDGGPRLSMTTVNGSIELRKGA